MKKLLSIGLAVLGWSASGQLHASVLCYPAGSDPVTVEQILVREHELLEKTLLSADPRLAVNSSFRDLLHLPIDLADAIHGSPLLSVNQLLQDQSFFRDAVVHFDAAQTIWTARWAKPRLFNFGMLLKPELLKRVAVGQSLMFYCQGTFAALSKNEDNELLMEQGGEKRSLGARDIVQLLESRIETGGISLFLDAGGDLILEARGNGAKLLAQAQHRG